MADKKSEEENPFGDFNDEFNFDDEGIETETPSPVDTGQTPGGPRGPNKLILLAVLLVVVGIVGFFGYRFLYSPSSEVTPVASSPQVTEQQAAALQPKTTPEEKTVKKEIITPPTSAANKPSTTGAAKQPITGVDAQKFINEGEVEIAKAFDSLSGEGAKTPAQNNAQILADLKEKAGEKLTTGTTPAAPVVAAPGQTPGQTPGQMPGQPGQKPAQTTSQAPAQQIPGAILPIPGTAAPETAAPGTPAAPGTAISRPSTVTPSTTETAQTVPSSIPELQKELFGTPPSMPKPEVQTQTPIPIKAPVKVPSPMETAELAKTIDTMTQLNKQMENNLNQIKYLEAYTKEISETVSKLNSQISAMDNRILALTNTANSLSKDVGSVRTEVGQVKQVLGDDGLYAETVSPKKIAATVVGPGDVIINNTIPRKCKPGEVAIALQEAPIEYTLHAVIPGRAWLKSVTGQIITVTEGDVIGNFGKIIVIDATNGVVLTNSGITFR